MSKKLNVFILTGAGISAESGVKTFRDNNGLWENHRIEEVATPQAFKSNPELVYRFYNLRRAQLKEVTPNNAHKALAKLQNNKHLNLTLVTQNVDDLHERGGFINPIHMHGEMLKARCLKTHKVFDWTEDFTSHTPCPCCNKKGNLRPDIVWFGEMPMHMMEIEEALMKADLFICIGTSGVVYPAAGFVQTAKYYNAKTVEINLDITNNTELFDVSIKGKATIEVPKFLEKEKLI